MIFFSEYQGIEGTEQVDKFAKETAKMPFNAPDTCCSPQKSHLKQAINKWQDNKKASHWQTHQNKNTRRHFYQDRQVSKDGPNSFSKGDLGQAGYLTGRAAMKCHLHKLGNATKDFV